MKKLLFTLALVLLMGTGAVEAKNSAIDNIMTRTSIRESKQQPAPKGMWKPGNMSYNKYGRSK